MKYLLIIIIAFQTYFINYLLNQKPLIFNELKLVKVEKIVPTVVTQKNNEILEQEVTTNIEKTVEKTDDKKILKTESDFEKSQKKKTYRSYLQVQQEKELFWWTRKLNLSTEQEINFERLLEFMEDSAKKEADLNYDKKKSPMEWYKFYYQTKEELLRKGIEEFLDTQQKNEFLRLIEETESYQFSVLH